MSLRKGIVKSFNSGSYTADVLFPGVRGETQEVAVARNIPRAEMLNGRKVIVLFAEKNREGEALVLAVYGEASGFTAT